MVLFSLKGPLPTDVSPAILNCTCDPYEVSFKIKVRRDPGVKYVSSSLFLPSDFIVPNSI